MLSWLDQQNQLNAERRPMMGRMTHFKAVLKDEFFARLGGLSQYLRAEDILAAASAHYHWRARLWTPLETLWTFLIQVLHPDWPCRAAVAEVLAEHAATGHPLNASPDPSAYCQGRQRLPWSVFKRALRTAGETLEAQVDATYRWLGRRVWIVDGSSCSMPDTPELQRAFGQPDRQKPGCGFPVAKITAMFAWASGAVLDVAIGPYRSSELRLWRQLWNQLKAGDVVLGDRFYGAYADMAQLVARGCDGVFRLRGARARTMNFRRGHRLGRDDRLITWRRSKLCPRTLWPEAFALLPETIAVRILRFHTRQPGFRSETVIVATTLLDPIAYPVASIAALYGDRWTVELRLRDVKTTLHMDVLRGKSADVVRKEIVMHFLAYNLIRALMWQAAAEHGRPLHRLSFAGTMQRFDVVAPYLWLFADTPKAALLYQLLLSWIACDRVPHRPGRLEPRALKRRPKPYKLLNRPRNEMRKALLG
jgi:hypothetical protein